MKFRCIIFISLCLYKSNIVTPLLAFYRDSTVAAYIAVTF